MTGAIPEELGNLASLRSLHLGNNQLTGAIPEELGNLASLRSLYLNNNQLTGEIPEELGNLASLVILELDNNQLTGEIPEELGNLASLRFLYLDNNLLTGAIPEELGNLARLYQLHLDNNQLTGEIPEELGNLASLQRLELDNNQLTGEIPEELGNLASLVILDLDNNQLTGEIPEELGNLARLLYLYLGNNQLTGEIPEELGNLASLLFLHLDNNQLTGAIPEELGNLNQLFVARFAGNALTGCVPNGLRRLMTAFDRDHLPAQDFIAVDANGDGDTSDDGDTPGLGLPFCTLRSLTLSGVTLAPAFASDTVAYTASATHDVLSTTVMVGLYNNSDTVAIMKGADTYMSGDPVPLNVGENVITIKVTPADSTPVHTYEVTINVTATATAATATATATATTSSGSRGGGGGRSRATPTPTPTPSPTPTATPTPTGPQFSGQIAAEPSVTATVVPEGTTLGLNGGGDLPGGVYVNFPPTAVALPVPVSISLSNEAPSDVVAPSGTTLLPLTINITPETPLTLGEPLTIEINPTPEQLAAAGGDLNNLAVGVVTPNGIVVLPAQVMHGRLVVTTDRLAPFVLLAVTDPGPVLTQPPPGDASSMGPLLQWTQPPGTTWFQVQVIPFNEDGPGINLVIGDSAQVRAAQYQVLGPNFGSADPNYVMLPDMTYLWRVRTSTVLTNPTEADWSAWAVSSFKTPPASSSTITRVAPPFFGEVSTLTPTLTWANSNTAVFYYEVQVSKDFEFGPNAFLYSEYVHGGASTPANSYVVPEAFPLEAGEIYYWRVRPRIQGDGDPLPWSAINVFLTPG